MCHTVGVRTIRIIRDGCKHRVGAAHIREAIASAGEPILTDDDKLIYIGIDSRGVELEIAAVPDDTSPGGLAVIHAMPTYYRTKGADDELED